MGMRNYQPEKCEQCRLYRPSWMGVYARRCKHPVGTRVIPDDVELPGWCPLRDDSDVPVEDEFSQVRDRV